MTRLLLALFFILISSFSYAEPSHFTLSNGMEVIAIPNDKVPAVSHMVWYKVGAMDEPEGKSGIAHFLEHLMFKGTPRYSKGQFSKLIAKAGGNDNAFTSQDFTAYYQNISKDKLPMVMDMESDRMQNLTFDNEEVLKERDVILEERSMRIDNNPAAILSEKMKKALYQEHPYGTPVIGWRVEMEQLSIDDAKDWYNNYYTPANAILVVSGDITADELKPLAERYYGNIKSGKEHKHANYTKPLPVSQKKVLVKDEKVLKPEWDKFYLAPSQNTQGSEHSYALTVLSYIMAGSDTSRMYQDMVVEKQLAAAVSSSYNDLNIGNSIFSFSAIPAEGQKIKDVEETISEHIEEFMDDEVTKDELSRAKSALIADTIYAKEDLKTFAYLYGHAIASGAGFDYMEKWSDNIEAVTAEDIQKAAKYVFNENYAVTGYLEGIK